MDIIKDMRKQPGIWWSRGAADRFGKDTFADPVQIKCFWWDTAQEYKDKTSPGTVKISQSVVYVDREMKEGDYLKLGSLESTTQTDPRRETAAFPIVSFERLPTLGTRETSAAVDGDKFLLTARL